MKNKIILTAVLGALLTACGGGPSSDGIDCSDPLSDGAVLSHCYRTGQIDGGN